MSITTRSAFTYGHTITVDNQSMPFSENGVDELVATFRIGAYTLGDFATEMARAMNEAGTLNYVTTLDRSTYKITISGDAVFWLYVTSSTLSSVSPYSLLGFTTERSGTASSYEGDLMSGSIFKPQFLLQSFVAFEDNQEANEVTVNETASGRIQVVKYGDINFMECNITAQTNIRQAKGSAVEDNPTGEDDLRAFMKYIVTKAPIEFIPDRDATAFTDCLLEKTQRSSKGTGYKLKELYTKGYANWWESGLITFREIK